jgi:hypothetical protein
MSVVTAAARTRWAAVAVGVAVLVAAPGLASAARSVVGRASQDGVSSVPMRVLLERARASASVPHSGRAQSRGTLGLPDLPRLGDVGSRLGGTTDTRVWWAGPTSWRVDVLTATGEQGTYRTGSLTALWDYESARRTDVLGDPPVRLPRADDLLPPQVARRFLGGLGPDDRVEALPGTRPVAGVPTHGVRLVPGDARSTIGHIDLWIAPQDGLPVAIDAVDSRGATALTSRFTQLSLGTPRAGVLRIPSAAGIIRDVAEQPDIAARLEATGRRRLPDSLAGLRAWHPVVGGSATYGPGLTRFVVLPVLPRLAGQLIRAGQKAGGPDLGFLGVGSVLLSSGALNAVVTDAQPGQPGYAVAGLVTPDLVREAARELLVNPPPRRFS